MRRYCNFVRTPQMDRGENFGGGKTRSNSQVIAVHVSFAASPLLEAGRAYETNRSFFEGSRSHVLRAPSGRDSTAGGRRVIESELGGRGLVCRNLGHFPGVNSRLFVADRAFEDRPFKRRVSAMPCSSRLSRRDGGVMAMPDKSRECVSCIASPSYGPCGSTSQVP